MLNKKYQTVLGAGFLNMCLLGMGMGLWGGFASSVHAETIISWENNNADLNGAVWTKEGSPYVISIRLRIDKGKLFTVKEGVTMMVASSSDPRNPYYIHADGDVHLFGTEKEPIRIIGMGSLTMRGTDNKIEHTNFEDGSLYMDYDYFTGVMSSTTVRSTKVSGSKLLPGVEVNNGTLNMFDSEISGNVGGLISDITTTYTDINIHNSVIMNNTKYDVQNLSPHIMNLTNNWWGSAQGPGNRQTGPAVISPWLTSDPRVKKDVCCSNAIFLPGLEGSRLYRDDKDLLGGGTTTHRAWEPFTANDVKSLSLDSSGKSIDTTIHTKDILDSAFGVVGIYGKFMAAMDSFVAQKTINEWLPFAYDWRLSMEDIALGGVQYATTTKLLVKEIERLAASSKTGKVTIIAHSYGGLITKTLGAELDREGKSNLVDKVILVAVPELGTPQAVAALLHGADQALGKGFVVKADVMRTFGLTMPGAYALLPSAEYFNRITDPIITFAGNALNSFQAFGDFLTAKGSTRLQAPEKDLASPAVLSSTLFSHASSAHARIDSWKFPTTTEVMSIAGWGVPTTRSIEYGSTTPRFHKTSNGDSTVVSGSATAYNGEYSPNTVFFNLGLFNRSRIWPDITHADILDAPPLRSFISQIMSTSSLALATQPLPDYLSYSKPNASDYPWMKWYTVSVHSPVDMDIYDSHGGHMGFAPVPGSTDPDVKLFENTIGGQYDFIGDEKYFTIPADENYTVQLKGTGMGSFTYQVQKLVGEDMTEVSNTVYTALPVTPLLVASTTISSDSSAPPLELDIDGNGTTDIKASPSPVINPMYYLDAMKTLVLSLHLAEPVEKMMLLRIEHTRPLIEKDKKGKAAKRMSTFVKKLDGNHWMSQDLTASEMQALLDSLDALLASLETM
jgi:pimeloyl-ACP methyl ester carboxylesterase